MAASTSTTASGVPPSGSTTFQALDNTVNAVESFDTATDILVTITSTDGDLTEATQGLVTYNLLIGQLG